LIFDDSSFDTTIKIIDSYYRNTPTKINYFKAPINNGGPAFGRNWGIVNGSGKYICFLDADDFWLSNKIDIQINFLEQNNYKFCGTKCIVVGSKQFPDISGEISTFSQLLRNKFSLSSLMFNRDYLIENNIYFDTRKDYFGVEDYDLILRLYHKGYKGYIINSFLVNYFHTSNSLSHKDMKKSECKRILVLNNYESKKVLEMFFINYLVILLKIRILYYVLRGYLCKL
jgi:glycosyltransferase involved in cell wall biosynthesis